jgi:hypothetical protein
MKAKFYLLLFALCAAQLTDAKENPSSRKRASIPLKTAANCNTTTAQFDLDINNVRARILNGGDMWWDPVAQTNYYEVPKGSNKQCLFTGAIWFAGIDNNSQVRAAAQTYRQSGANDFWAGPISKDNSTGLLDVTTTTCTQFDRFWVLTKQDVQNFINGGTATTDIMNWPGNGNVAVGELPFLAPFYDADNDGIYNYLAGDYPYFNLNSGSSSGCSGYLKGDKTVWWVFNDIGNTHTETFSNDPIGLEIRAQAFAYSSPDPEIDNTTFYEYQVINRSNEGLNNVNFGVWCDPDLGNASDDYVGCDVNLGLGYCYNGDPDDDGATGYGINPPAVGTDILQGPLADANDGIDNDRNGITDEPGEDIIMSKFVYYENVNSAPNGNPEMLDDYYQLLSGQWLDGTGITYGGNGMNPNNPPCSFMFPDDTDPAFPGQPWTMATAAMPSNDMRFLMSAGTFTLEPGEVNYITTATVWARATSGGPAASIVALQQADSMVQSVFDNCFVVSVAQQQKENNFQIYPMPCVTKSILTFDNASGNDYVLTIYNQSGEIVKQVKSIKTGRVEIDRTGLSGGIYMFGLSQKGTLVHSGKISVL